MTTKQVFISYKREDRPRVKYLAENLRLAGNIVWFDESLQVGDHWWDAIMEQIEQCDVFVFAISQLALRSIPCQRERAYAAALGKPMLLIQVGVLTAVPAEYATIQYGNFSKGDLKALIGLSGAINRLPAGQPNKPDAVRPDAPIAPIEEIAAILDTQANIEFKDQTAILYRLKAFVADSQTRARALELVAVLLNKTQIVPIQDDCQAILAAKKPPTRSPVMPIVGAVAIILVVLGVGGVALSASHNNGSNTPLLLPSSTITTATAIPLTTVPPTVVAIMPTNSAVPPTNTTIAPPTSSKTPTATPSYTALPPSITPTPLASTSTNTPHSNAQTLAALTYTQRAVNTIAAYTKTPTATPTATFTPSLTPSLTPNDDQIAATIVAATDTQDINNQTATATLWTFTPTATPTATDTATLTFTPTSTPTSTLTPTLIPAGAALTATVYAQMTKKDMSFVYVPPGCFLMGSDPGKDSQAQSNEQPQHQVCITKGYWIGEYTVTNAQFAAYQQATGSGPTLTATFINPTQRVLPSPTPNSCQVAVASSTPNQPVVCVSWTDAAAYTKWFGCRLPTEAEWEYAARSPASYIYPWGNTFDKTKANTSEGGPGKTMPVGSYESGKSWVGAYDMAGNVWQWVNDWYDSSYYGNSSKSDPTGPTSGTTRSLRGGSWLLTSYLARAAVRSYDFPDDRLNGLGFRVVCSAPV